MGDYIPAKLGMDDGEQAVYMAVTRTFEGHMVFAFENGKAAKVEMSAYATKTKRKKLIGAYSTKSPLVSALYLPQDHDLVFYSAGRVMVVNSAVISAKSTRDTQGVQVMNLKKGCVLEQMDLLTEDRFENPQKYRPRTIPGMGSFVKVEDEQTKL